MRMAYPGEETRLIVEGGEWQVIDSIGRRLIRQDCPRRVMDQLELKIKRDLLAACEAVN